MIIIIANNIFGTSHIICIVLQCGGDHQWFRRSAKEKRSVTRENTIDDGDNNNNNNTNTTTTTTNNNNNIQVSID